jgi:hypothetical protein
VKKKKKVGSVPADRNRYSRVEDVLHNWEVIHPVVLLEITEDP